MPFWGLSPISWLMRFFLFGWWEHKLISNMIKNQGLFPLVLLGGSFSALGSFHAAHALKSLSEDLLQTCGVDSCSSLLQTVATLVSLDSSSVFSTQETDGLCLDSTSLHAARKLSRHWVQIITGFTSVFCFFGDHCLCCLLFSVYNFTFPPLGLLFVIWLQPRE